MEEINGAFDELKKFLEISQKANLDRYLEESQRFIEVLIKEKKLLEAKIVNFRMKLEEIVTKDDKIELTSFLAAQEDFKNFGEPIIFSKEIGILLKKIENNPIIKLYDEHFDIKIETNGKI